MNLSYMIFHLSESIFFFFTDWTLILLLYRTTFLTLNRNHMLLKKLVNIQAQLVSELVQGQLRLILRSKLIALKAA